MTAFEETYQHLETYLRNPEGTADAFWEDGPLLWVDWRDYDEDIAWTVRGKLPSADQFDVKTRDSVLPRGQDILLMKDGLTTAIPYAPDRLDRDTTLRAVQAQIAPAYQLRCFVPSMENDTLGFCLLTTALWRRLEETFGARTVARQFQPIGPNSRMFG